MLEVSFNVRIGKVGSCQHFIDPKCTIQFFFAIRRVGSVCDRCYFFPTHCIVPATDRVTFLFDIL